LSVFIIRLPPLNKNQYITKKYPLKHKNLISGKKTTTKNTTKNTTKTTTKNTTKTTTKTVTKSRRF